MKLSEVIKAIEDGSKSKFEATYKSGMGVERVLYGNGEDVVFCQMLTTLPYDGWEEIKPPRQWSEEELMLFKLLPDWVKWITFDKHGIYAFEGKPTQENDNFKINENDEKCTIDLTEFDCLTITFEESPVYIGDLKG